MNKQHFLCIHGHFYQPPRENPWLDLVEPEFSALPFHDWNERITRECYAPNAWARIHSPRLRIEKLVNNYAHISFDMGATLISWIHQNNPRLYERLLEADEYSKELYGGHGTAMAQVYNHIIMPLADKKDKETQIRWGIQDFKYRFKREPEGMWLAETAVDTETLELLAQNGIRFTILSPYQAEKVRPIGSTKEWKDVSDGSVDVTMPYRVFLPSGAHIDIFFYNKEISQSIAFGNALSSGEQILKEVTLCLFKSNRDNGIVTIATDGESYGHHFKFGDLALAWMIENARQFNITLISPGWYLEMFPPNHEVKIKENSSWSCAHGVKRWEDDCGCSLSGRKDWNQKWRRHLRDGLNWLRDELRSIFEKEVPQLTQKDPYELRNSYIDVLIKNEDNRIKNKAPYLPYDLKLLRLLESQRMAMYMFTSCGWFFDDITGIEATQNLKYAKRAVDLIRPYQTKDLMEGLMSYLVKIRPNDTQYKDGKEVFERLVLPFSYTKETLVASTGVCSLLQLKPPSFLQEKVHIQKEAHHSHRDTEIKIGEVKITEHFEEPKVYLYVVSLHKSHLNIWVSEGELSGGMDQLILQGLGLRAQQKSVISQLRNFIGDLKAVDPLTLPKEMIYSLLVQSNGSFKGKSINVEAGKTLYAIELIREKTHSRNLSHLNLPLPSSLKDLLTNLVLKFLLYENISGDDIGLKRLLVYVKEYGELIDKKIISHQANTFIRRESENLFQNLTKSSMRKLLHYLMLHRLLQLETDLFYLQNSWWDIFNRKEFIEKQPETVRKLFFKLGEALGFNIKVERSKRCTVQTT